MIMSVRLLLQRLYKLYIEPRNPDQDGRRREFILNTLLAGMGAIAILALSVVLFDTYILGIHIAPGALIGSILFWIVATLLLLLSRAGYHRWAAVGFAAFLLISTILFALSWSFRLAQVQLLFALTIVVVGVVFRARFALLATGVVSLTLIAVAYVQVTGLQVPYTAWQDNTFEAGDAIGYLAIFVIMGIVSWLANRETDRALQRARASERALQKERDNLEIAVAARTRELEDLQVARLLELQPFAEFGRIGANLVHEIANPLTAASLNLEELNRQQHSELVQQLRRNLQCLESYLLAARKQIKRESDLRTFTVGVELRQIVRLLTHRAQRAHVRLAMNKVSNIKLYGDAVKFSQVIANVVANAIDASENNGDRWSPVTIDVRVNGKAVVITVSDKGVGITSAQMKYLFEPFYSTKADTMRAGLGIGLAMVKQYVEKDFKGTVRVKSSAAEGTVFELRFRGLK
jgi:signal transduction histidine kinase